MNEALRTFAQNYLIDGLQKLPESHRLLFKRMYSQAGWRI